MENKLKGKEIRIALAGLGNCASALIQGIEFYKNIEEEDMYTEGLMNSSVGGYLPRHIKVVAAFDVSTTKINKDIAEAIYAEPNSCFNFVKPEEMPHMDSICYPGPILDGCYKSEDGRFSTFDYFKAYDESKIKPVDITQTLKDTKAEILINLLPVGSHKASRIYAQAAINANCGFINGIPEFIVSERIEGDKDWVAEFEAKGLPCVGDDIKSQVGATLTHRVLTKMFLDRGVNVKDTYQLNIGGNSDFYNMKMEHRLKTKRE